MDTLHIFTDGSYNPVTKIGCGAYIAVTDIVASHESIREQVKVRRFENSSSVRLELETLLWAFNEVGEREGRIIVYTDSQNIIKLPDRRRRLEENNYKSGKGMLLKNADLYIEFFRMTDRFNPVFIKVQGHMTSDKKGNTDKIFTLVDKESRRALRKLRPC